MDGISQEEMRGRYQQIPDFDSHLARGRGGLQCRPYRPCQVHNVYMASREQEMVLLEFFWGLLVLSFVLNILWTLMPGACVRTLETLYSVLWLPVAQSLFCECVKG